MKKVSELKEGDYIAFSFNYNGTEEEIIVSKINFKHEGYFIVHFAYNYHSLSETVKYDQVLAIGNKDGNTTLKGWFGNFDIIQPDNKLIRENLKTEIVTVLKAPITNRYVNPGNTAKIDYTVDPIQIRVNDAWFKFDHRWEVVKEENKKEKMLQMFYEICDTNNFLLTDQEFTKTLEMFGFSDNEKDEEIVMQWLVDAKNFVRCPDGWIVISSN